MRKDRAIALPEQLLQVYAIIWTLPKLLSNLITRECTAEPTNEVSQIPPLIARLYRIFMDPMIFQRYRNKIIGEHLNSVHISYVRVSDPPESYPLMRWCLLGKQSACVESYSSGGHLLDWQLTLLQSYLVDWLQSVRRTTCLVSYSIVPIALLLVSTMLKQDFLWMSVLLPVIGLAQSTNKTNLTDFTSETASQVEKVSKCAKSTVRSGAAKAYGYLRQSQTDEDQSSSIQSQKKAASNATTEYEIPDTHWFKDVNESGYSFEREGFQNLIEALEREPRPVVLDRIDRLGRDTLETIHVAAKLHYEYEVPIITAEHGHYELDKIDEQLDLVLNAIIAGKSVKNRVRASWKSIKLRFSEDRKWHSWFQNIPVGYQSDEEEWIEPAPHASEVITAIINDVLETETLTETVERIRKAATNESLGTIKPKDTQTLSNLSSQKIQAAFEGSDYEPSNFDRDQLKRLLTNHLLIGEVRYPRSADHEEQSVIEMAELAVVDEELFNDIAGFFNRQKEKNSTDCENNVDMETLADLGLILLAIDSIDVIKPVCPECNRGMVRNGEDHEHKLSDGRVAHYWMCPHYKDDGVENHGQRKVPYNKEWEALKNRLENECTDSSDIVLLRICPPSE